MTRCLGPWSYRGCKRATGDSGHTIHDSGGQVERSTRDVWPVCLSTLLKTWIVICTGLFLVQACRAQDCGKEAQNALCRDDLCCSEFGFCGSTTEYCGTGCQSNCVTTNASDPDVICGRTLNDSTCAVADQCCSEFGYCGVTDDYCGNGCQNGPCIASQSSSSSSGTNTTVIAVAVVGGVLAASILIFGLFCLRKRRRRLRRVPSQPNSESRISISTDPSDRNVPGLSYIFSDNHKVLGLRFSYDHLNAVTNGFSEELGRGAFGVVYKGILSDKTEVAVKSLLDNNRGLKDFEAEIKTLGNINHANLVALRGFCYEPNRPAFIVYEFAKNGSLDKWIFSKLESPPVLAWKMRVEIARGTAKGLAYLHEELQIGQAIIHLDIKPENILLDEYFTPKVADFGMAKLIGEKRTLTIASGGTFGYMAPETYAGAASTRMDVYSFGVVLLELVCGRRHLNISLLPGDEFYLPIWALRKVEAHEESDILDPALKGDFLPEEARRLIIVSLLCQQRDPDLRPDMSVVWKMLEGLTNPPEIPESLKTDLNMTERILRRSSAENSERGSRPLSSTAGSLFSISSSNAPTVTSTSSDSRQFQSQDSSESNMRPLIPHPEHVNTSSANNHSGSP